MKNLKNIISNIATGTYLTMVALVGFTIMISSCSEDPFPEAGSLPDLTPPSANFVYTPNEADYTLINFENLSNSSTDYSWDLGNGQTSTDKNPSTTYDQDGEYTVTLTATDKLNQSNTISKTIEIIEPIVVFNPVILEAGFEDLNLPDGTGDGRDSWRNNALGGVIQITTSPVFDGEQAAKFPAGGDRIGYQLVTVLPDIDYKLSWYYTIKTTPVGSLSLAVLSGPVSDPLEIAGATLASVTMNDQSSASTYVSESLEFNSGSNSEIAIYISNEGAECRLDLIRFE